MDSDEYLMTVEILAGKGRYSEFACRGEKSCMPLEI